MKATVWVGHVLERLAERPPESVQCVVTTCVSLYSIGGCGTPRRVHRPLVQILQGVAESERVLCVFALVLPLCAEHQAPGIVLSAAACPERKGARFGVVSVPPVGLTASGNTAACDPLHGSREAWIEATGSSRSQSASGLSWLTQNESHRPESYAEQTFLAESPHGIQRQSSPQDSPSGPLKVSCSEYTWCTHNE